MANNNPTGINQYTKSGNKTITKPKVVKGFGGKNVLLRGIAQKPDTHFPARKVKVGGKIITLKAFKVRGALVKHK